MSLMYFSGIDFSFLLIIIMLFHQLASITRRKSSAMEAIRVVMFRPSDRRLFSRESVTCARSTGTPNGASLSMRRGEVAVRSLKGPDEKCRSEPFSDELVVFLKNEANGAELYLVGTSHISKQSIDDVRVMIKMVKPDYVMVELDKKRFKSMMGRSQSRGRRPFAVLQHVVRMLMDGNIGTVGKLMGLALFEFHRQHTSQGIRTGMEMRAAVEEGEKLGAQIVLGDQDFNFTLKRFGELTSGREAWQCLFQPLPKDLLPKLSGSAANNVPKHEQLRDRKLLRKATKWLDIEAPVFNKVFLDERNEAMVQTLRSLSGKIVGVVGLAHLDGMEQLWHEANEKHCNESTTND